ncbi:DUF2252 domain-containing protein [Frateuria aurantia]
MPSARIDIPATILAYNQGRDAALLARKYAAMRTDPFVFLRGSCHLFYARLPSAGVLRKAPASWICGDLHMENFGSYKGDNQLVYFDLNDFDEATLAPCSWELLRLLTSVRFAMSDLGLKGDAIDHLCEVTVDAYASELQHGKARWIERDTADGLIGELLGNLRSRRDLLAKRTIVEDGRRRLRVDGLKLLPASQDQSRAVRKLLKQVGKARKATAYFEVLDVARRVAGTGSLGVARYIALVQGKGGEDGQALLDLKQALGSSLHPGLEMRARWSTPAEQVVAIQRRMQAVSPALLQAVVMDGTSFVLRALQPSEDRVDLHTDKGSAAHLQGLLVRMGQLTAWAQLRSSGRDGSACADDLIAYALKRRWKHRLVDLSAECAQRVQRDWKAFARAYDQGYFGPAAEAGDLAVAPSPPAAGTAPGTTDRSS